MTLPIPKKLFVPEYITNGTVESGSSGTLRENLPKDEQICMLMLELRATRAASPSLAQSIFDCFTKIEVIGDGRADIVSLTSENLDYAAFVAQNGISPDNRHYSGNSSVNRLHIPIWFGRFPWDLEYMLDTGLYNRVQVVITWNLATTNETFTSFTHTISYWRPVERQPIIGVVRAREVETVSSPGNSATKKVELPKAYPWNYLWARIVDQNQNINTNLSTVDLRTDASRLKLADVDADELYYMDKLRYAGARGPVIQPAITGTGTFKTHADWSWPRSAVVVAGNRVVRLHSLVGEEVQAQVFVADTGANASDQIPFTFEGDFAHPHKCLTLLDGRAEPFDAPAHSDNEVEFVTGSTGPDSIIVCVKELVPGKL